MYVYLHILYTYIYLYNIYIYLFLNNGNQDSGDVSTKGFGGPISRALIAWATVKQEGAAAAESNHVVTTHPVSLS